MNGTTCVTGNLPCSHTHTLLGQMLCSCLAPTHKARHVLIVTRMTLSQAGHPEAAAAFTGKIPHDFLPHLLEHEAPEAQKPREEL